jgi:hypothetical protein
MAAQNFVLSSGTWYNDGWSLYVDEQGTGPDSSGKFRWDMKKTGSHLFSGSGNSYFEFQPGTTTTNGTWTAGGGSTTRNGHVITTTGGQNDTWNETNAFVNGVVPTTGTSTEEVFVPDAKIVNYGGLTGLRFEQRSYPAASYELIGPDASSTWSLTSQSSNLQYHISNLTAGTYYLWQDSVQVATLIARDKRKVHCNFW